MSRKALRTSIAVAALAAPMIALGSGVAVAETPSVGPAQPIVADLTHPALLSPGSGVPTANGLCSPLAGLPPIFMICVA